MAGFRKPGPTDALTNATPIDSGTLALTASPTPGVIGTASKQWLSKGDLEFIWSTLRGARLPLHRLQALHEQHIQQRAEALRQHGPGSWHVSFQQATIDRLRVLIDEGKSPLGRARDKVRDLTDDLRQTGSADVEQRLSKAIGELLAIERQRQLSGESDDSSATMGLVANALNASADRRNAVLERVIEQAKRSPALVPDEQLRKAVTDVLGVERERQLLGVSDDNSKAMGLVTSALNVSAEGKSAVLKTLIARAKRSPASVPDEQLRKAMADVIGTERQRQLMGVPPSGGDAMELVEEASRLRKISTEGL